MANTARAMFNQHENFEIEEVRNTKRLRIVRQDRHEVDPGLASIEIDGSSFEVLNFSAFGLAVACDDNGFAKKMKSGAEFDRVPLIYANTEVQTMHLRFVRTEALPPDRSRIAFEIVGEPLITDRIHAITLANEVIERHMEHGTQVEKVPQPFRLKVYQVKDWLEVLQQDVQSFEEKIPSGDSVTRSEYEQTSAQIIYEYLKRVFPSVHAELPKTLAGLPEEDVKNCVEFLRTQLKHLIYQAPFSSRAYSKPRGYAGDYEMMNHLYRDEYIGDSLFAKCLHHYFINEPAGQAVRNRAKYLEEKITQTFKATAKNVTPKFLSVASGPAMELQLFLKNHPEFHDRKAEFHCLDQDEESLKYAQREIRSLNTQHKSQFEFRFAHQAIKNIIVGGVEEREYDLIYSAGLFDYLSDPVARLAAERLMSSLKKGGRLIIGNFNVANPTLPLMNLAWDWHLIYRSADDLKTLLGQNCGDMAIENEELAINLFCVLTK